MVKPPASKEERQMTKKRGAIGGAALFAVFVLALNVLPSAAQAPPPEPIATEFLTDRAVFTDRITLKVKIRQAGETARVRVKNPSRTVVARFTLQPGAEFPWHSHRGPVFVNVVSGALTYVAARNPHEADDDDDDRALTRLARGDGHGCFRRTYPAGTAFVDPGRGHVHSAFNSSDGVTVLVATFFKAPAEGPLLIPASPACS
jgi:quercetin dioxygenase-like cupin family protein